MNEDENIFTKYCKNYNYIPTVLPARRRVVAIGDIHADSKLAINCLLLAKVISISNNKIKWIGEDTYVIQSGDQIDGCRPQKYKCNDPRSNEENAHHGYSGKLPQDIYVMNLFSKINKKAMKYGGAVISLLGNHELMNSQGNVNYVSYADLQKSKALDLFFRNDESNLNNEDLRKKYFKPGTGELAKLMACDRISTVIIGDVLFAHAGILSSFIKKMGIESRDDLYKINIYVRKWLLGLINEKNIDGILSNIDTSPFWQRLLGQLPVNIGLNNPECDKYIKSTFEVLNVGYMIISHTPQFSINEDGINSTCDGTVWRIDTGSAEAFDKFDDGKYKSYRNVQVLEILNENGKTTFNVLKGS